MDVANVTSQLGFRVNPVGLVQDVRNLPGRHLKFMLSVSRAITWLRRHQVSEVPEHQWDE